MMDGLMAFSVMVGFSDSWAGCAELKRVPTTRELATVASMALQYNIPSASLVGEYNTSLVSWILPF
jgi:hypothetical protein